MKKTTKTKRRPQEAAAAADPGAQAEHVQGFRLLTIPTNSASQQQEAQA